MNDSTKETLVNPALCAGIYLLLSIPQVFGKSNFLTDGMGYDNFHCPTFKTRFINLTLFFVLIVISLKYIGKSSKSFLALGKYAIFGTLLFFLISSQESYTVTGKLYNGLANLKGCPTMLGSVVHAALYYFVFLGLSNLPDE
jgi:hypothetical protein